MGSPVPEADMNTVVSQMQSSCNQYSKFAYKTLSAPEAEQLLCSIRKPIVPSKPVTATASAVVRCAPPVTTSVPLTATRVVITKQPGNIVLPRLGSQLKIIVGSADFLQSLNTCMQAEGRDEEEEMADRSRSPSPPHPIFNGPVVRYEAFMSFVAVVCFFLIVNLAVLYLAEMHLHHCFLYMKVQQHNTPFNGPLSRTTRMSWYLKGKTSLDLLKRKIVSGSGISWAVCKSAPCPRQITTAAPHHSNFYRLDALPAAKSTASKL